MSLHTKQFFQLFLFNFMLLLIGSWYMMKCLNLRSVQYECQSIRNNLFNFSYSTLCYFWLAVDIWRSFWICVLIKMAVRPYQTICLIFSFNFRLLLIGSWYMMKCLDLCSVQNECQSIRNNLFNFSYSTLCYFWLAVDIWWSV